MTKIDIFSGFLGAGKTTLIKKCLKEAFQDEQIVLIENEFGEIGIDGGFLQEAGVQIREMNSGCICCSLVGDFSSALTKVVEDYHPDRILIEPSGVGKLSDIIGAIERIKEDVQLQMNSFVCVADAKKVKMYSKNFGEFYNNQIESANVIVLSRTQDVSEEKLKEVIHILRELNSHASIITTDWDKISGKEILDVMESRESLDQLMMEEKKVLESIHHNEECECGHHHHHDEECGCGHHHHHDEECECGHHHHHHHDADEVFVSIGVETADSYTKEELQAILEQLKDEAKYGTVLRAKGFVRAAGQTEWLYFDYVAGDYEIRTGTSDLIGRFVVIGSKLNKEAIEKLILKK